MQSMFDNLTNLRSSLRLANSSEVKRSNSLRKLNENYAYNNVHSNVPVAGYQGLQGRSRRSVVFDQVTCTTTNSHKAGVTFCLDQKERIYAKYCNLSSRWCYWFIVCTASGNGKHKCSYARHEYYDYCCSWTCTSLDSLG